MIDIKYLKLFVLWVKKVYICCKTLYEYSKIMGRASIFRAY